MENTIENEYQEIESYFFDIDKENETAYVKLKFESPKEIFDNNYISKKPILNDDFMEWLQSVFDIVPMKYSIDFDIEFDDMEGYTNEELKEIFERNILLEYKTTSNDDFKKTKTAMSLVLSGIFFFVLTILIDNLWSTDSLFKSMLVYITDIGATVTFWEALTISMVEKKGSNFSQKDTVKRFRNINFSQAGKSKEN